MYCAGLYAQRLAYLRAWRRASWWRHPLRTLNEERYHNEIIERLKLLNTVELASIKAQLRLVLEQKENAKQEEL